MGRHLKLIAPFDVEDCGKGLWCLRQHAALDAALYVHGSLPIAQLSKCEALGIEWLDAGGAIVSLALPSQTLAIAVNSAFVQAPRPQLYGVLPLVRLDQRTRRFWRRVFAVARLPGGQFLLGWLAARTRRKGLNGFANLRHGSIFRSCASCTLQFKRGSGWTGSCSGAEQRSRK